MLSHVLTFGPFLGQTVAEVAAAGRVDYLRWLRDARRTERTTKELTDIDPELDAVVGP